MAEPEDGADGGKEASPDEETMPLSDLADSLSSSESEAGEQATTDGADTVSAADQTSSDASDEGSGPGNSATTDSENRPDEAESPYENRTEEQSSTSAGETDMPYTDDQQAESSETSEVPLSGLHDEMVGTEGEPQTGDQESATDSSLNGGAPTFGSDDSDSPIDKDPVKAVPDDDSDPSAESAQKEEANYADQPLGALRDRLEDRKDGSDRETSSGSAAEEPPDNGRSSVGTETRDSTERGSPVDSSLVSPGNSQARRTQAQAAETEETSGMDGQISRTFVTIHMVLTGISFVAALAVYFSAVGGLIDQFLWILSLPLFTLALFGLVPIVAWYMGYWNPTELE